MIGHLVRLWCVVRTHFGQFADVRRGGKKRTVDDLGVGIGLARTKYCTDASVSVEKHETREKRAMVF